ncbi:MAG: hypothetical protein WDZ61_01065 [Parcubacteria group bacterium]
MRTLSHILSSLLLLLVFLVPAVSQAQFPSLIVCGESSGPYAHPCGYNDLIRLAINLINFMIILSTFLAVAVFAFVGIKLLTSGGNERAKDEGKEMAFKVLKGYLWILGAWLLVYTISSVLLEPGYTALDAPR